MPKPKAYRAIGFPSGDSEQITQTLTSVLKTIEIEAKIWIRAIAPRADKQNEFTAVFIFVDGDSHQCEGSYKLPISQNGSLSKPKYISIDSHFRDMTILHQPTEGPVIDFLVIPGLGGGHAYASFQDSESEFMWLLDRLPEDHPGFRIMTYGYDTTIPDSDSFQDLEALASAFRASLVTIRAQSSIPLVYLVHSLGGLVAKQAMVHMEQSPNPVEKENFNATYAMLFFGVPNTGMNIDGIRAMFDRQPNEGFIMSLAIRSHLLRDLHRDFTDRFKFPDARIVCFYETRKTASSVLDKETKKWSNIGEKIVVVDQDSATHALPGKDKAYDIHGLNSDHRNMVRCAPGDTSFFSTLNLHLKPIAELAPDAIKERLEGIRKSTINVRTSVGLTPEQKRVLNSLNQPPYTSFRNSSKLVKPEKGTLQWLVQPNNADRNLEGESEDIAGQNLRMEDFISWRDSNKSEVLLIAAPPGRGKSVLSNFVLEHLESRTQQEPLPSSKIVYYFCNIKNDEASRNANSILRALIVQLCEHQQRLYQNLPREYENNSNSFFSAPFATIWHIFEKMLQDSTYTRIYCVIDGLDVYQEGMTELIIQLIENFNLGIRAKGPVLKLLCTTRPQTSIMDLCEPSTCKILRCSQQDLETFIESRIRSLRKSFNNYMRQVIKKQLYAQAENTFLWLEVVIRRIELMHLPTNRKIEIAIKNSPKDLDDLYSGLVRDLVQKDADNARLLAWVVYARRPLDLRTLQDAMAIDPAENYTNYEQCSQDTLYLIPEEFLNIFGTLLDIAEDKVYCIHQSFKDYVERQKPLQDILPEPRLVLAHVCMAYLSLEDFGRPLTTKRHMLRQKFPLFEYAAIYWYSHIETAVDIISSAPIQDLLKEIISPNNLKARLWMRENSRMMRENSIMHFTSLPLRVSGVAIHFDIGWLAELLLNRKLCDISDDFEKNCLSEVVRYEGVVLEVLLKHERGMVLSVTGEMVEVLARRHHCGMMTLLLDRRGADVQITEEVVKAAAGNWRNGKEVMTLLLDRRGADVQITEEVVKAAAGNWRNGKEVITLLLDRRGADVQITEEVVGVIARGFDEKVMTLLLDRRGADIQITENVLKAAIWNWYSGKEIMTLLLDRYGADIQITTEAVIAVARNWAHDKEVMTLLFDQLGVNAQITEEIVGAIANSSNQEVMTLLLDRYGAEIQITEEVIKAAAGNWKRGTEVVILLLDRREVDLQITEDVVKAAAENWGKDKEVMTLLLDRCEVDIQITEEIVEAAAGNWEWGKEVMTLLLDRYGADIQITENVLKAAAWNWYSGKEMMTLLLDRGEVDIQITKEVVKVAIENEGSGKEVITLLLDRCGIDIQITEEVAKAATGNWKCGKELMTLLLDRVGINIQIPEEVFELIAKEWGGDIEVMTPLFDRLGSDAQITERIVGAVAGYVTGEVVALLFDRLRAGRRSMDPQAIDGSSL